MLLKIYLFLFFFFFGNTLARQVFLPLEMLHQHLLK